METERRVELTDAQSQIVSLWIKMGVKYPDGSEEHEYLAARDAYIHLLHEFDEEDTTN